MDASPTLPDLVAAAQANARVQYDLIAQSADPDQHLAAIATINALAVDIFAVFEVRMQHHFKRGPFSRKLHALLTGAGQPDLAYRMYQYYLAINVLKHGTGSSYRELLTSKTHLFAVNPVDAATEGGSLIDVTPPEFFDGLTGAILECYRFLER